MNLEQLLKSPLLRLPKDWKELGYNSYYESVIDQGTKYLDLLNEIEETRYGDDEFIGLMTTTHLQKVASRFYHLVLRTLQSYLNDGNPYNAYVVFDTEMTKNPDTDSGKRLSYYLSFDDLYTANYRMRVSKDSHLTRGDLFHVPFDKRHIVNSARYSIPGYPTLYLSNCAYLAYKELGEPKFENLWISKFLHTTNINKRETLLNMRFDHIYDMVDEKFKYLCRWILTMACSIKLGYPNANFKSEYILPQILFQWVKNNFRVGGRNIIGVTFSSTKVDINNSHFNGQFYNTAIPIHTSIDKGYCSVQASRFDLTEPRNVGKAIEEAKDLENIHWVQVGSISENGQETRYSDTKFHDIEQLISSQERGSIFS